MHPKQLASFRLVRTNAVFQFLALLLILIWVLIAYDLKRSHDRAFDHARYQLRSLTNLYAEEVSSSIDAINYVLIDLREEWEGDPIKFDAKLHFRQQHLDPAVAFNVSIIDAQGTLIYTSSDWNARPVDLSDRHHFKFHQYGRGDELYISAPVLLRSAHRLAIQFTRPLPRKDGKFNGVIVVSVSPEYFYRFYENVELGKDSSIALARIYGDLLARYPQPGEILNKTIQAAPWIGARPEEQGFFQKDSEVDSVERLYAWRVLEKGDLAVVMGQSMETILAPYHQQRNTYLAWGCAVTIFILLAAYAIRRYRRQRAKADAEMQRMEDALERSQKLESIGKLTGGVAHDFNNILQIISSNIQVMEMIAQGNKTIPPEEIEPHLKSTASAIERGSKLASQLLTFARRQPLRPTLVDLSALIENIDSLIQRLIGHDIKVQTRVADDLWKVEVDPALFENVILNLAANARDAMDGKGILSINLCNKSLGEHQAATYPGIMPGDYVMLAITDSGTGMPPEVLEHVFEPFFTTKPEGKGTGLGLAMAYGFVKESGGHIHIDSEVGVGTTIRIFLPRSMVTQGITPATIIPAQATGGKETILMVEDNPELRRMVSMMLEGLGYHILQASSSQDALDLLEKSQAVDVLFTDVLMPGRMDGIELAKQAKTMHPGILVLLASGSYDLHESIEEFQGKSGNVDFLQKPYKIEQVDAAIRKLQTQKTT